MAASKAIATMAPQRVPRYTCAFAMPNTVLTQEESVLAYMGM